MMHGIPSPCIIVSIHADPVSRHPLSVAGADPGGLRVPSGDAASVAQGSETLGQTQPTGI
jgi:hypothetical protein